MTSSLTLLRALALSLILTLGAASPAMAQDNAESGLTSDQARAIADLLRDDKTREALLSELDRVAGPAETTAEAAPENAEQQVSIGRQIAETTQAFAEDIASGALRFWERLVRAPDALDDLGALSGDVIWEALIDLALVLVVTFVALYVYRWFARRLYRVMGRMADDAGGLKTAILIGFSVGIDALVVAAAWATGYAVTLVGLGDFGSMGIHQTLFLNAFLLVEMIKVVVRAVLAPTTGALRPVNLTDYAARVMAGWLTVLVGLLGYGHMLAVPIVNQNVSWLAGRSLATVVSLIAVIAMMGLALRYRRPVAEWLAGDAERRGFLRFLAHNWHVPVMLYLLFLFAIVLTRPGGVLFPLLAATGKVLAAVIVGAIIGNVLHRAMVRGIALPENVSMRLPLLERRLNSFVPKILMVLRMAIIGGVIAFALDTIGLLDATSWLESAVGVQMTETIVSVAFVLLMSFAVWLAISSWIDYRLNPEFGSIATAREQTLLSLLRNAVTIVLIVITLMFVLSEIGIDIAPLIASAGVLGLAIGFGAQKMVQDIITGIFIQFENAMNVGDVVTVGGTTGTVERLTIRSVSLRDVEGVFHIIPFSSVDMVSNYMRDYGNYLCDMGIAYREDVGEAKQAMLDAFEELRATEEWSEAIMGDLQWFGLQAFGDNAVVVRARIKCRPGQQWGVGRAYNEIVKRVFDERGIEIPFPHQTIYFGEDKHGKAPPLRLRTVPESSGDQGPDEPKQEGGNHAS